MPGSIGSVGGIQPLRPGLRLNLISLTFPLLPLGRLSCALDFFLSPEFFRLLLGVISLLPELLFKPLMESLVTRLSRPFNQSSSPLRQIIRHHIYVRNEEIVQCGHNRIGWRRLEIELQWSCSWD
jgi:hypothetical protein